MRHPPRLNSERISAWSGAGYAGLTAALRLQQAKRSVVLLEARDRIGGRSWSDKLSDGTQVDLGAGWIGSTQHTMVNLAKEFNVPTYRQYVLGKNTLVLPSGQVRRYQGFLPPLGLSAVVDLGAAIAALDLMASTVPATAPWEAPKAREWDSQSVGIWLQNNVASDLARRVLQVILGGIFALNPVAVSLLHYLLILHTAGGMQKLVGTGEGEADEFRIFGGTQIIADKIAETLGGAVRLNAPVREIIQNADGVEVIADTVSVHAQRVIVAIPTAVTGFIRFRPILPPDRAQLIQRFPEGTLFKVTVVYDEAFWRNEGLSGESLALNSPFAVTLDGGLAAGEDKPGLLTGFLFGDDARRLTPLSPAQRQQLIVGELAARFGPRATHLSQQIVYPPTGLPYVERNWSERNGSGGTLPHIRGPASGPGLGSARPCGSPSGGSIGRALTPRRNGTRR